MRIPHMANMLHSDSDQPGFLLASNLAAIALTTVARSEVMKWQLSIEEKFKVPLSENDLLERVGSTQDRDSFAKLFAALGPRVKAYMMKIGSDPAFSEEITQETFITVWRKAGQFDPKKASAVTWIFTIARNRRIDRLRKEKRPALDPDDPMLVPDDSPTPLQNMEQSTIVERVKRSIGDLPEDQREVVQLSFIEGLSHQEISDAIGIPLGTVKSRLRLSFEKLRHALGDLQ
jgi:RNA polymerase sigma-70 factor (ECF subfamily)